MPDVHAKLSASGAKKWINCPGSVEMEARFPDKESSYAAEGTTAHSLGEAKIRLAIGEITKAKYAKAIKDLEIDADMDMYTDMYRDFVLERFNAAKARTPDAMLLLEQRLDFSRWVPGGFGTGDCVIVADGYLEIIDLKYGSGVVVSAVDNPQLRLYALGAFDAWDYLYGIETIRTTIFQPRRDHVDTMVIYPDDLIEWAWDVKAQAELADSGTGDCIAGSHCDDGFCKARPVCKAYADQCSKLAALDFKHPNLLDEEDISEVLELSSRLVKWSELVKAYALDQAKMGVKFPGYKLVEGRASRRFTADDETILCTLAKSHLCESDAMVHKLRTVADMEKVYGKAAFDEVLGSYVVKDAGAPTLVPITDKRPEINSNEAAADDFKDIIA